MSLSVLGLVILLILLAINWLAWASISATLLGWVALIDAILWILEGLGVWGRTLPSRR